jgi:hypothetical protein
MAFSNKERISVRKFIASLENHFHNYERWFGSTAGIAPALLTSLVPFSVVTSASVDTFGTAIAVMNGSETPVQTGMTHFDLHKFQIADVTEDNQVWKIRIADSSGGHANYTDAVAAGYYTEFIVRLTMNANQPQPISILQKRLPVGTKIWIALANHSAGAETMTFFIGIHEYKVPSD